MPFADDTWIRDLADGLLATALATLPDPKPTRTLISFGVEPPWDCEQLAVTVVSMRALRVVPGARPAMGRDLGPHERQGGIVPSVEFLVHLLDCGGPTITGNMAPVMPSPAEITSWAESLYTSGWALYRGLMAAWHAGTLYGAQPSFRAVAALTAIGDLTPLGPQGGLAGWKVSIVTNLA